MSKSKTLIQEAIRSLNRRAGQYNRHRKYARADLCEGAAKRLKNGWRSRSRTRKS